MATTELLKGNTAKQKNPYRKYIITFLCVTFGLCWGGAVLLGILSSTLGDLTLINPFVRFILESPALCCLLVYFMMGGWKGVLGILRKVVPAKSDLIWFPILLAMVAFFYLLMHYGSIVLGFGVPEHSFTFAQRADVLMKNLLEEAGLIGVIFGFFGFLLPYLQTRMKQKGKVNITIKAGLLTGLIFGLFVLPGYVFESFETATLYPFYVAQFMMYSAFTAYVFNATKGNLLLHIFTFWLLASGSKLGFYFFNPQVQVLQIVFFGAVSLLMHYLIKKNRVKHEIQILPEYVGL